MHCYTFGAPRVGNCAWAAEYEGLVPSTFHVINDQVCAVLGLSLPLPGCWTD